MRFEEIEPAEARIGVRDELVAHHELLRKYVFDAANDAKKYLLVGCNG